MPELFLKQSHCRLKRATSGGRNFLVVDIYPVNPNSRDAIAFLSASLEQFLRFIRQKKIYFLTHL